MSDRRVMIAGVGNIFLGDDGFGVEVATVLARRRLPAGVEAADYGIRGVHLAYQLLEGYDALVLVDTVDLREPPGTLGVLEVDPAALDRSAAIDAHSLDPATVLATLNALGGCLDRVLVLGCQPASVAEGMGLSDRVSEAVERAADEAIRLAVELLLPTEGTECYAG
jgi:hydrogenase maturation protease